MFYGLAMLYSRTSATPNESAAVNGVSLIPRDGSPIKTESKYPLDPIPRNDLKLICFCVGLEDGIHVEARENSVVFVIWAGHRRLGARRPPKLADQPISAYLFLPCERQRLHRCQLRM